MILIFTIALYILLITAEAELDIREGRTRPLPPRSRVDLNRARIPLERERVHLERVRVPLLPRIELK